MKNANNRVLLISNSTLHRNGYLDHAAAEICDFLGSAKSVLFHAELSEVVAGTKPGRTALDEIIIFDSTGMALQDVIAAATVYKKAADKGIGRTLDLAQ